MHKRGCRSCCTNYSADRFRALTSCRSFPLASHPANGNKVLDLVLPGELVHQTLSRKLVPRLADTQPTCAEYRFPQVMKEARWKKKVENKASTDTTVGRTDHNQANFSDATTAASGLPYSLPVGILGQMEWHLRCNPQDRRQVCLDSRLSSKLVIAETILTWLRFPVHEAFDEVRPERPRFTVTCSVQVWENLKPSIVKVGNRSKSAWQNEKKEKREMTRKQSCCVIMMP